LQTAKEIEIVSRVRRGRGFRSCEENVLGFDDLSKFAYIDLYNIETLIENLFRLENNAMFAFTITDAVRLTGFSNSLIHKKINAKKISLFKGTRFFRTFPENLIVESEILKLNSTLNIKESILDMFRLE